MIYGGIAFFIVMGFLLIITASVGAYVDNFIGFQLVLGLFSLIISGFILVSTTILLTNKIFNWLYAKEEGIPKEKAVQ